MEPKNDSADFFLFFLFCGRVADSMSLTYGFNLTQPDDGEEGVAS